jgi:catechol 2,3-dioxygenase-like lactoylglutathione lyase family enzyme
MIIFNTGDTLMRRTLFTAVFSALLLSGAPAGQVVTFGNLIHNVASLEDSAAFYHDALGLELAGAMPVAERRFAANPQVARLYGTPGSEMRGFTVRLPDSPGGLEFNQFKEATRSGAMPAVQNPGSTVVVLKVKNLAATLAKVHAIGAAVITPGGPAGNTVLLQDPDGFFVELIQPENAAASAGPGNVIAASLMITVSDMDQTLHLYRDLIGIPLKDDKYYTPDKALSRTMGLNGARYRHAAGDIPGTKFQVDFVEIRGVDHEAGLLRSFDVGSANLRFRVTDEESFVANLQAQRVKVASDGGEPLTLNNNVKTCILSDPDNNFFFQIMSAATPRK